MNERAESDWLCRFREYAAYGGVLRAGGVNKT